MMPTGHSIRAVLGVRGEPTQPDDPAKGMVWRAIVDQINEPGSDSEWITVADLPRDRLTSHPWSLSGGAQRSYGIDSSNESFHGLVNVLQSSDSS